MASRRKNSAPLLTALLAGCLFAGAAGADRGALPDSTEAAWDAATRLLVDEAADYFDAAAKQGGQNPRPINLARAALLLNAQPKTEGNIQAASALLEGVASGNRSDAEGITARYLLARISHFHAFHPDRQEAIRRYESLHRENPEDPLAQSAAVRAAMLRVYAPGDAESKRALLTELEGAPPLSDPSARREMAQLLADGWNQTLDAPEKALPHLIEVDRIGLARQTARLDLSLRVAETARILGDKTVAAKFYRQFLTEAGRDQRMKLALERLAELEVIP